MSQQFLTGSVYANGQVVTADILNATVNSASMLPGAITTQATGTPVYNDWIVYANNASTSLKKIQVESFLSLIQGFSPTFPKAAAYIAPGEIHTGAFTFVKSGSYTEVTFTGPTYYPGTVLAGHKYYLNFTTVGATDGVYEVISVVGSTVNFPLLAAGSVASGVGEIYLSAVNRLVNVENVCLTTSSPTAASSLLVNLSTAIPLSFTYNPFVSCTGSSVSSAASASQFRHDYHGTVFVPRTSTGFAVTPLGQSGGLVAPGGNTTILVYSPYSA